MKVRRHPAHASFLCLLPLLCLTPSPGRGQSDSLSETLEWIAFAGGLLPTRDLATVSGLGLGSGTHTLQQQAGAVVGTRITAWWSRHIGWDVGFSYSPGSVSATSEGGGDACGSGIEDCTGDVWVGASRLLIRYVPASEGSWYLFGGMGVVVVGHSGAVWEQEGALTDFGGAIGVGGAYELSRRFALRLELEDYIYSFRADFEADSHLELVGGTKLQNDLVLSLGLAIRSLGR